MMRCVFSVDLWERAFNDACERLCPLRGGGHECGCLLVIARLFFTFQKRELNLSLKLCLFEILIMPRTRGRGNRIIVYGRGSRSIEPSLPSPPHVQNPPHSSQSLHSEPQSPGFILSLGTWLLGVMLAIPTTEPQGSDPPVVPSSADSRTDRTVRKNVLYVEPADDP
ncbi:hypothetical protein RIF29_15493 [Crotalaria pallida]|uniref:Uncharacterized protein n=1 Tax=Crotalaria pallida TaxID=3830 RepID=A0AAN9FD90_CROPI